MRWFSIKERKTSMQKKHHTTEQVIRILREAEGSQMKAEEICRKQSISPQT
jgi:hypothetical protein